tara:strand:- start:15 stop:326 length:312 start_codon:yes stop_codon:yes gene_type:complete
MSKQLDISIEEINTLLQEKQSKINNMEKITKNSREKLIKINNKLDKEKQQLITLITKMVNLEGKLDENTDNNINIEDIQKKIKKVTDNLRKIRNNLADIIRNK